jgi:cellobiose phosphorylase
MTLTGQVFPIMSGGLSKERVLETWQSIKNNLYDKELGGFRLNTDFGSLYLDLGRAFGFAYGDKENGAVFSHMVVMLAHAMYEADFADEGNASLASLYKMATSVKAASYPGLPEYFNSQGQGLYLYLTGSASWFIYTILEEIVGIKYSLGDLIIEPKLIRENFKKDSIKVGYLLHGKKFEVKFTKGKSKTRYLIARVFLNDQELLHEPNRCLIKKTQFDHLTHVSILIELA